ncbi:MAG: 3-dehydroquinate synthase [Halofilum sp. (in: g-proteobacteria)]|nr:3-dehydroquinate synthase [Halofilum sp. (in: g-proteobacteria)]
MDTITVDVELGDRSYPILIGRDLLDRPAVLRPWIRGDSALIVTNETVAPLYLERLRPALGDVRTHECILPDGERHKNLEVLDRVFDCALANRLDRATTLVALGGGVIGDMAGFAAAVYQRGVDYIQVPTTLLAQVDSSVGGKTGVNHPRGKNMIGAFHQPRCVLADTATLDTLEERQLRAGLAEVIKYGLIADAPFFDWLEAHMAGLLQREPLLLAEAIERSCRNKAAVVAADEYERGRRALLNLGHTFGHAIETATGYGPWLHGEAIAAGMCMAARLSERLGRIDAATRGRVESIFEAAGLPTMPPAIDPERMLALMAGDKKVVAGTIRLVLLDAIGAARVVDDYPPEALAAILADAAPAPSKQVT